jgi:hypothetical protein
LTLVAGCSGQPAAESQKSDVAETAAPAAGVERQAVEPTSTPIASPVPAAIQVQPGPKGATVSLNKVAVVGDIMTVALSYSGSDCCIYTPIDQVSVIDDTTSQRLSVLKDNAGNWMAAPVYSNRKEIRVDGSNKSPAQVWFKFPAPPATSKTVSITLPEVAPFDAVPVTR